ncbi:MAG: phage/plasmid replication protein, II/X family [Proteobacteria bacterium]|nr:phage/plasmid replication protein, II/X family [Pseudomonadota bacterium]
MRPVATLPGQATHDVDSPHVRLSRVDVNYMADLGSEHDVAAWLSHARRFATFNNRASRADAASTVYFASGKSRRARLKFYAKGPEFIVNAPRAVRGVADEQQSLAYRERALLADTASGKLRAELSLHRVALDELRLRYVADWNALSARATWSALMENFDMPSPADTVDTSALPKHLAAAYHLWRGGEDLLAPGRYSRRQWYRLRAELRALVGIDIGQPCADPLPPIVQAEPATLRTRAWPRNVFELFPADDEPAPAALVAAGLYFEPRTDWRIEHRPAPVLLAKLPPKFCPWPRDPADRREVA